MRKALTSVCVALPLLASLAPAASAASPDDDETTLTGCLAAGDEPGEYVLTDEETDEEIDVEGPDSLAAHVGHRVKLTGSWVEDDDEGDEEEEGYEEEDGSYFHATAVEHISDHCGM